MAINTKSVGAWVDVDKWKEIFWGGAIKIFTIVIDYIKSLPWWTRYVFYACVLGFCALIIWGVWINRKEWRRCKNY